METKNKLVEAIVKGIQEKKGQDYGDVLVHIFIPEARDFYNLENLWQDAAITNVPNLD